MGAKLYLKITFYTYTVLGTNSKAVFYLTRFNVLKKEYPHGNIRPLRDWKCYHFH